MKIKFKIINHSSGKLLIVSSNQQRQAEKNHKRKGVIVHLFNESKLDRLIGNGDNDQLSKATP